MAELWRIPFDERERSGRLFSLLKFDVADMDAELLVGGCSWSESALTPACMAIKKISIKDKASIMRYVLSISEAVTAGQTGHCWSDRSRVTHKRRERRASCLLAFDTLTASI